MVSMRQQFRVRKAVYNVRRMDTQTGCQENQREKHLGLIPRF